MANLKTELDEYLSSKNDTKPLLNGINVNVFMPKVGNWFRRNENVDETDSWYERAQKDCCPSLTRIQRITGFCMSFVAGILCFIFAGMYIPVLLLKARKFTLLYSTGSLFIILSFSFLWGPMNHLKHLFSKERFCFSLSYFGSLTATLYCALHLQSTPLTVLCSFIQLIALLWYLISYIPGGHTGMMFFTKLFTSSVSKTLPI